MKKVILGIVSTMLIVASSTSSASMSYECWAYVEGSPSKMVHVSANSATEAQKLAKKKMNKPTKTKNT